MDHLKCTWQNHIHVKVDGPSQVHVSEILLQYRYAIGHLVNYLSTFWEVVLLPTAFYRC